jgi:hypothetical protein
MECPKSMQVHLERCSVENRPWVCSQAQVKRPHVMEPNTDRKQRTSNRKARTNFEGYCVS